MHKESSRLQRKDTQLITRIPTTLECHDNKTNMAVVTATGRKLDDEDRVVPVEVVVLHT